MVIADKPVKAVEDDGSEKATDGARRLRDYSRLNLLGKPSNSLPVKSSSTPSVVAIASTSAVVKVTKEDQQQTPQPRRKR